MQARKWHGQTVAWSVVLGWHVLVGWWLVHAVRLPGEADGSPGLQVVYVALPPLTNAAPADVPPAERPPAERRTTQFDHAGPPSTRTPAPPMQAIPVAAPVPISATVLQQAHAYALAADPVAFAAPGPLSDRPPSVPPVAADRFPVRTQVTPALVLAKIGKLVGGPDYVADPCPRNRRNLDRLLAQGDSERLRIAIEYDRTYCRP